MINNILKLKKSAFLSILLLANLRINYIYEDQTVICLKNLLIDKCKTLVKIYFSKYAVIRLTFIHFFCLTFYTF